MGAAKKAVVFHPLELSHPLLPVAVGVAGPMNRCHDPLLLSLQTPEQLRVKNWKEVAKIYLQAAQMYDKKNARHNTELELRANEAREARIEQLERSVMDRERLNDMISLRDREIDLLKRLIHLLTKGEG